MKKSIVILILFVTLAMFSGSSAWAITTTNDNGTAHMTVDNHYDFYMSSNDSTLGTLLMSSVTLGNEQDWQSAESGTGTVGPGYLHIVARNDRDGWNYAGFLGDFTLNTPNLHFSNGTQSIVTVANPNLWTVYTDHFGGTQAGLVDFGVNDGTPNTWTNANGGPIAGISPNAHWIWTANPTDGDVRYFSTKITATPEPIGAALFVMGAGALGIIKSRRNKKAKA